MATRNPVRVLPEPVGEATRTSLPAAMWGQAADCGGVGPLGEAPGEPAGHGRVEERAGGAGDRASPYFTRML